MNRELLTFYGLKWNPFATELPVDSLMVSPSVDSFCLRIERHLVRQGGFALIAGEPGTGKSVTLRVLAERLGRSDGLRVCAITHPSSRLSDFYRETGLVFCPPGERREMIFGLVISFSMWQCAGHGDAAGPGFVH